MININIDYREKELINILEDKGVPFNNKNLELGDITYTDQSGNNLLIIERKTVNDLASSIKDGRYMEQSLRLDSIGLHNHNIIYLIEGDIERYKAPPIKNPVTVEAIYSSIFSIMYYKGFSVLKTRDIKETAEFIVRIYNKINKEKKKGYYDVNKEETKIEYASTIKTAKKDNITLENIDLIMLSQIPSVSKNIATIILSKYDGIADLIDSLRNDKHVLTDVKYEVSNGKSRKISKTAVDNIVKYLKIN